MLAPHEFQTKTPRVNQFTQSDLAVLSPALACVLVAGAIVLMVFKQ